MGDEGFGGLVVTLGRGLYVSLICWPFREKEDRLLADASGAVGELVWLTPIRGRSGVFTRLTGFEEGLMTGLEGPACLLEPPELLEYVGPSELLLSPSWP